LTYPLTRRLTPKHRLERLFLLQPLKTDTQRRGHRSPHGRCYQRAERGNSRSKRCTHASRKAGPETRPRAKGSPDFAAWGKKTVTELVTVRLVERERLSATERERGAERSAICQPRRP